MKRRRSRRNKNKRMKKSEVDEKNGRDEPGGKTDLHHDKKKIFFTRTV